MKTLNDVLLYNELKEGDKCYYNHDEYVYHGKTEEGYKITRKTSDGEVTKYLSEEPAIPQLPLGLVFKRKRHGQLGELVKYIHMLGRMYYKINIYEDCFKGYDLFTLGEIEEKWELIDGNPFLSEDEIYEKMDEFDELVKPLKDEINKLQEKIRLIEKDREAVQKYCKHEWEKFDEYHIRGNTYEQVCRCEICGLEKINRYSKY